ncbi:PQQ-binding-like beta-propeller repeat protein [Actinoplanes sp. DH11]|uniref:outer membrane protein assembly factor BamB family protein n=1 Tax=Actinoplanes sp. DH11 TaxID=2857011 RepID=UPI001E2EA0CC|nr:PQQ-binding-like beta-propeller repeat protein [Actinoplanes sp. DH11]
MRAVTRTPVILLSVTLAAGAAAVPVSAAAPAPGWEHPGHGPGDSYYNAAETVINEGSVKRLTTRWSVRLRHSYESCSGWSAPLVTGGRVIVADQLGIAAHKAEGGAVSWRFNWDDKMDNETPVLAVSDGLLIAANGDCNSQSDPDGRLTAIDVATGAVRWRLDPDMPNYSVVVDRGVVVVSGWSQSDEEAVVAYRAGDGGEIWRKPGWSSSGVSARGAVIMRKTDGYGQSDGGTSAVDVVTGKVRWSRLENWIAEAAIGDRVYVSDERKNLIAADATDGAVVWTAAGKASSMIAVDGRRVYRAGGRDLEALDDRTGRRIWTHRFKRDAAQPVRAGGLVHAGGPVLRAADGTAVGPSITGQVVVADGAVVRVDEGTLLLSDPGLPSAKAPDGTASVAFGEW